ncbi:phosphatase PAP2 family protein [Kitasatospora sp. NPDC057692]|uniref:phosphatase PAP2 family protein n=1 Tax=Kitasatospora sp. NPDC057692 TaxID=3346215 RepID=UPI0036B183AF
MAGAAPRGLAVVCWIAALTACGAVTWTTLADASGPHHAPRTAALLLAAPAAVALAGGLVARRPPPGLPAPAAVAPLGAAAVLVSAELRGRPADAVIGVAVIALVLLEVLPRRTAGLALGAAAALQPAALLFAPLLRTRAALTALAVGAAGFLALRLRHGFTGLTDRTVPGLHGPPPAAVWLVVAAAVALPALRRARTLTADGQPLLGAGVLGCATAVVAPGGGPADLGWLLLAATGRLGRRPEDRALWPVIAVTVALLPATLLDPGIEPVSSLLLRHAPALVALAAATVLPFRHRADPHWRLHRIPGPPPPRRTGPLRHLGPPRFPLLPARLRPLSRPNPVLELLLIQVGYGVYSFIRNAAPNRVAVATDHARRLYRLEQALRLDIEPALNGWALRAGDWLRDLAQEYYRVLHITVPLAVLVWLYARHPARYRTARTVLFAATGLALLGFWGYPLAPPRLVPGTGLHEEPVGTPGEAPLGALTALTNQYAAMPSLHIGWAGWCALVVFTTARSPWLRGAAVLYPVATFLVVVATANHWVLDAVGGAAVLLAGCLVEFLLTGRLVGDRGPAPPGPPTGAPSPADRPALDTLAHREAPPRGPPE